MIVSMSVAIHIIFMMIVITVITFILGIMIVIVISFFYTFQMWRLGTIGNALSGPGFLPMLAPN